MESVSVIEITGEYLRLQKILMTKPRSQKDSQPASRKPRADAQRNRERILEIAREAFTRSGVNVSLDDVAKHASVGAGTLYRHFPTRDALLAAVYQSEVEKLAGAQRKFAETMPPIEALRAWMLLFVDYIAAKLFVATGDLVKSAIHALVQRAIESGDIRPDLEPLDLLRALIGVSNVASAPDWRQSARRLVEILIKGSRPVEQTRRESHP